MHAWKSDFFSARPILSLDLDSAKLAVLDGASWIPSSFLCDRNNRRQTWATKFVPGCEIPFSEIHNLGQTNFDHLCMIGGAAETWLYVCRSKTTSDDGIIRIFSRFVTLGCWKRERVERSELVDFGLAWCSPRLEISLSPEEGSVTLGYECLFSFHVGN